MKKCKLGEISDIITGPFGSQLHASDYVEKGVPSIMPKDIGDRIVIHDTIAHITEEDANRLSKYRVELGDIVYSRRGDIERCALITESDVGDLCGTGCLRVRPDKRYVNPVFLSFYLSTPHIRKWIVDNATGATMPNLNSAILKKLPVELPDLEVQHKIAKKLRAIDDKVNINNKIMLTLESMAKTLYDYWFVQFDFPDDNGHPYKTSGGKMEWNETLSREIPIGWEVVQLKKFAEVIQGNSPAGNTLNLEKNGIAFYQGKTDFGMRFPIERIYTTEPYRYAEPMDTLLSVRAPVGSVNMSEDKCCIGRGLAAIHQKKYPSLVYYMMMRLQPLFEKRGGGGTTFDSITKDDIKDALICRPPKLICELFEKQVRVIDRQILNLTQSARKLSSLRDFLLPVLMNGQVGFLNEREDL